MTKRTFLLILTLLASTSTLFAQELKFDKTFHNFGKIQFGAGKLTHTYTFTNIGSKSLQIKKVQPSCGCTATNYTKSPVKPGEEGMVEVSFNPQRRSGYQQKEVKVVTNAKNTPHHLLFEAYILRKKLNKSKFDFEFGSLRLNKDFVDFGNIALGENNSTKIKLKNVGDSTVAIQNISTSTKITAHPSSPFQIKAGETQTITLVLNSFGSSSEIGIFEGEIQIQSAEFPKQPYPITGVGIFYPNIPQPEEGEKIPEIDFQNKEIKFGKLPQGAAFNTKFTFENKGNEVLTVYKVQSGGCSCTMPERFRDRKVKPGKKDHIQVKFNSESIEGPQDKKIYVFTNDPNNPMIVLSLKGEITPP